MYNDRDIAVDTDNILAQSRADIHQLCYLGLHQYAKENKLIGRSRPLINIMDMGDQAIRRLYFRLTVACIKEIVGTTHFTHGGRSDQVNYLNVHQYRKLRLYGLLDKDMFVAWQDDDLESARQISPIAYWPDNLRNNDRALLLGHLGIDDIFDDLGIRTRATLELGGDSFRRHLRHALRFMPEGGLPKHVQTDPGNRRKVRNIAININLFESPHFHTLGNSIELPQHIEKVTEFCDTLYPLIQTLQGDEAREHFVYVAKNYPGPHAISTRQREIQTSRRETERRDRLQEQETINRTAHIELMRERMLTTLGGPPQLGRNARTLTDAMCPHCNTEVGPNEGDQCTCRRYRRHVAIRTDEWQQVTRETCESCGEWEEECACIDNQCTDCNRPLDFCHCGDNHGTPDLDHIHVDEPDNMPRCRNCNNYDVPIHIATGLCEPCFTETHTHANYPEGTAIAICVNCDEQLPHCTCPQRTPGRIDPGLVAGILDPLDDAPEDVRELRRRVSEALGLRIARETEGEEDGD